MPPDFLPRAHPIEPHTADGIRYHGYLALICSFDDSTWVRIGRPVDGMVQQRFAGICREYHARINRDREGWCASNGLSEANHLFASYLYNPACFLTFGHTDSVGLVLVDDIDAMMEITADVRSPVEQVHLAYCPELASLGLAGRDLFCEPHELFDGNLEVAEGGVVRPGLHSIQTSAPLLLWARLKLNGIGLLGEGLLVQQAAYRAIACRIEEVVATLAKNPKPASDEVPLFELIDLDPDHLQVTFLDPQGAEEITLLIFCRNYTVGISLLTAVRALTLDDVFRMDPRIPRLLDTLGLHPMLLAKCAGRKPEDGDSANGLRANHLLSKSYTTLGVAYHEFAKPLPDRCGGYVLAYPNLDINPGHLAEVENRLLMLEDAADQSRDRVPTADASRLLGRAGDLHRFLVGRHDYLFQLQPGVADAEVVGLALPAFFQLMRLLYRSTECTTKGGRAETGLLDISTALVIPFPKIKSTQAGEDAILGRQRIIDPHQSIMPVLEKLRHAVFGGATEPADAQVSRAGAEMAIKLRQLGLPSSLRRTIRYFYQDFGHCLSDPFMFEGVLDLYDTFAALHTFLYRITLDNRSERGVFDANALANLEKLLRALHNALTHRIPSALPHWELRDMAVDFRGGLNRLLAAADVPLKCGLGVVRRQIEDLDGSAATDRVGAVTQITFNPNPYVHPFLIGEKHGVWLAHIDMDVAHIINPFEYIMYVHESCHLILRSRPTWAQCLTVAAATGRPAEEAEARLDADFLDEVAVETLTYLFVFAPSADLYHTHFVVRFNSNSAVSGIGARDALGRFTEILIRMFFATDPAVTSGWTDTALSGSGSKYAPEEDGAYTRFRELTIRVGPYFREYATQVQARGKQDEYDRYLEAAFRIAFRRFQPGVSLLWEQVSQVFHETVSRVSAVPWTMSADERQSLDQRIGADLARGSPFLRGAYRETEPTPSGRFDEFYVVTRLLRHYIGYVLGRLDLSRVVHTHRPPPGRLVDTNTPPKVGTGWNSVLLDPFRPGVMCLDPAERVEKLRRQIAVMKTLWDQSCTLRARRLKKLLSQLHLTD